MLYHNGVVSDFRITDLFIRRSHMKMETLMRMPHDERHRDWSDEATRQQTEY